MNFYIDGKYNAFEELMYYYHWDFYVYYLLTLIIFINCSKAIVIYTYDKKYKALNYKFKYFDLFISMLAGIGLGCGMFFQGILSDISSKYCKIWGGRIVILCIVACSLFIIQLIFCLKSNEYKKSA